MRKQIIIGLNLVLILFLFSAFVIAEGNLIKEFKGNEPGSIGDIVCSTCKPEDIIVKGVTVQKPAGADTTFLTFQEANADLKIKNTEFTNIAPAGNGKNAYVKIDSKGQVTSADFYTNEKGSTFTFGNDVVPVPPNSRLVYGKDDKGQGKMSITALDGSELKELPRSVDKPDSSLNGNVIEFTGKDLKLPNGNLLNSGKIVYDQGNLYLMTGSKIDNLDLSIQYGLGNEKVGLFFDGKKHEDFGASYLSLNSLSKEMYLNQNGDKVNLDFNEGNPFVKVEKGDTFVINSLFLSELSLSIKNPEGKIPVLSVDNLKGIGNNDPPYPFLANGNLIFARDKQGIMVLPQAKVAGFVDSKTGAGSSPILIDFSDSAALKNKVTIISNSNGYSFVDKDKGYGSLSDLHDEISSSDLINDLKGSFPKVSFNGLSRLDSSQLNVVKQGLSSLSPKMLDSFNSISFENSQNMGLVSGLVGLKADGVAGMAWQEGGLLLSSSDLISNPETVPHEVAHKLHQTLGSSFDKEWYKVQPKETYMSENDAAKAYSGVKGYVEKLSYWEDGSMGARSGFVRPYGQTNIKEDVATMVETVYTSPEKISDKLTKGDPNYDPRYGQKLDLLLKYGFITKDKYNQVLDASKVK